MPYLTDASYSFVLVAPRYRSFFQDLLKLAKLASYRKPNLATRPDWVALPDSLSCVLYSVAIARKRRAKIHDAHPPDLK